MVRAENRLPLLLAYHSAPRSAECPHVTILEHGDARGARANHSVFSCASFITLTGSRSAVQHTLRRSLRKLLAIFRRVDSLLRPPSDAVKHAERTLRFRTKHASSPPLSALSGVASRNRTRAHHLHLASHTAGGTPARCRPYRAPRSDVARPRAATSHRARRSYIVSHTHPRAHRVASRSHRHIASRDALVHGRTNQPNAQSN